MAQYVYTMNRVGKVVPPKREILKNISLSFFPGAKIGVLGLNGSGKSTLLRIMAGIDQDYNGEARPMPDIKVGYLPQEPQLDGSKDVRGNVEEGLREALDALAGLEQVYIDYAEPDADFDELAKKQGRFEDVIQTWDAHNLDNKLEQAADSLRLPPWDADVSKLSGGERRRVEIARALVTEPKFMLLDEPFAGIDPIAVGDIQKLVRQLTARGIGVLITDHNVRETLGLIDRAYIIHSGEVLMEGTPEDIVQSEDVRRVYLGDQFTL